MSSKRKPIRTAMGYSTPDRIVVRGFDLPGELLGHINLGDMAFLEMMGRIPTSQESVLFNALAVTLVEHGLTPSALAARLTYAGAPESIQGAVAAGLGGLGTVFSYTVVYQPPYAAFKADCPFVMAIIQLDEGPQMMSNVLHCDPESVRIGMKVKVCFETRGDGFKIPQFEPA